MSGWRYLPGAVGVYSGLFNACRSDRIYVILIELYTVCVIAAEKPTEHEWVAILLTLLYFMLATVALECNMPSFIRSSRITPRIRFTSVIIRTLLVFVCGVVTLVELNIATGVMLLALFAALIADIVKTARQAELDKKKEL